MSELKKVVVAVGKVGTLAGEVLEDGRVTLWELPKLAKLSDPVQVLLGAVGTKVLEDLDKLDEASVKALAADFAKEFDLPSDVAEHAVEEAGELLFRFADVATDLVRFGKRLSVSSVAKADA